MHLAREDGKYEKKKEKVEERKQNNPNYQAEAQARERQMIGKGEVEINHESSQETIHYRIRPIKSVQFRFDNLGSHFIRVLIFIIFHQYLP